MKKKSKVGYSSRIKLSGNLWKSRVVTIEAKNTINPL